MMGNDDAPIEDSHQRALSIINPHGREELLRTTSPTGKASRKKSAEDAASWRDLRNAPKCMRWPCTPPPWAVNFACPGCDWSQHIVIKVAYEEAPENPFLDCFGKASAIQRTHSSAGQSDTMKSLIRFACLELPLVRPLQPLLPELGDDGREA